jgi:thiol:disulfide interchange protein DsbD
LIFAASFFGAFEIVLPSKWVSTSDSRLTGEEHWLHSSRADNSLVSFSVHRSIVGALLVEAAQVMYSSTIGMFGFGLAFALSVHTLCALPSWRQKMPKSGGWLNSVKVVLGFIMLAFSLKFASMLILYITLGYFQETSTWQSG